MTGTRRLYALLPLLVWLLSACFPQPADIRAWTTLPGPDEVGVVVMGDSLSDWARSHVEPQWVGPLSYNALGGTQIDHWDLAMNHRCGETVIVIPGCIRTQDTVVVALGTNDVTNNLIEVFSGDVVHALESLRDVRCVVWLTLDETGGDMRGFPYDVRTRTLNQQLYALQASGQYPNLVLDDWAEASRGHDEYLVPDHVHHLDAGRDAYAEELRGAPVRCP